MAARTVITIAFITAPFFISPLFFSVFDRDLFIRKTV
jgi:hypothetical protein